MRESRRLGQLREGARAEGSVHGVFELTVIRCGSSALSVGQTGPSMALD